MGERDDPCVPFFVLPSFFLLFLSGRWRDILFVYQSGGVCEKPKTMGGYVQNDCSSNLLDEMLPFFS